MPRPDEADAHRGHAAEHDGPEDEAAGHVGDHADERRLTERSQGDGRRGHAGRGRDARGLGQRTWQKAQQAHEAPRQQEESDDGGERELEADVQQVPRVHAEQDGGRHQDQQRQVSWPREEAGDGDQRAGHAGAHDGRSRADDDHVDGDHRQHEEQAQAPPQRQRGQGGAQHRAEQHHVLAGDGHDVQQAGAAEVVDRLRINVLGIAEDHAAQDLPHRRAHSLGQRAPSRHPQPVCEARKPATAAGELQVRERGGRDGVDAASLEVPAVVEAVGAGRRQQPDARARHRDDGALDEWACGVEQFGRRLLRDAARDARPCRSRSAATPCPRGAAR